MKADFKAFYEARTADVSPANMLYLAVAEHWTFPATHGGKVAHLNSAWDYPQSEWKERSESMEKLGLLERNASSEFRRSILGTAIVYLALQEKGFARTVSTMRSDKDMAKKWGI